MAKEPLLDTRPPGWEYGTGRGNKAQKAGALRLFQKRPTYMAKETCVYGKRAIRALGEEAGVVADVRASVLNARPSSV